MKNNLLILFMSIFCMLGYSQINFNTGYYITNNGEKIECQIRNVDWRSNPTSIEYKLTSEGDTQTENIKSIKEFGILNDSKFVRALVDIDRSTKSINSVYFNRDRNPVFKEEELFLKVLVEGKANLYEYVDGNITRYFYNVDNYAIEQLIYKTYLIPAEDVKRLNSNTGKGDRIGKNTAFKQQLWNNLKCESVSLRDVDRLTYKKNSLTKFFIEVNSCNDSKSRSYGKKEKGDFFNLTLRPRVNNNSLTIFNSVNGINTEFDKNSSFGVGIEAEYILPFNKNKWSLIFEPSYQTYKTNKTEESVDVSGGTLTYDVNFNSIELPIGVRHYFFITDNSKIFLNAGFSFIFNSSSNVEITRANGTSFSSLEIVNSNNAAFGLGYKYNDRYSFEIRYQKRDFLVNYQFWNSDYKTISFILGYSFF